MNKTKGRPAISIGKKPGGWSTFHSHPITITFPANCPHWPGDIIRNLVDPICHEVHDFKLAHWWAMQ